ncbi:MAG: Asp-tRNA(Asn)/Glu-tRNA(Gln) amidotransferase subunit GatA [Gemmatimonadetes bacterium]|jgi:aspartyl-tRNA(Asn)/glutamyl-tRNA(Gln) amidotransferase subunit A|nr:Asp-tRNA(Asn)/Glu-tRNA(Gln) amidotransferase subunit GatA [Gemmatimonadota bacterium]
MTASEIAAAVRDGTLSPLATALKAREDIVSREGQPGGLNAFLALTSEELLEGGVDGLLAGVPVAVKDNLATRDLPTTCGSKILEGYQSPFEATVVRRLREAGAVLVGKTNMDEFAMGSSTENSAYGPTRNPAALDRVPGGSSGGSAAAVAAGYVPIAVGSDTGGSVRQPASFCGVVGIKPTYGRVSRYGLVAFASSLDQVGTFGRTVHDAALALQAISGHDPRDATSADREVPDFANVVHGGMSGMVVGVPREYVPETLDAGIRRLVEESLERLRGLGATVKSVSLPHTRFAIPAYYVLAPAEASSNLARYDGVRFGERGAGGDIGAMYESTREAFGPEVKRRIMLGTYALSSGYYDQYYGTAQRARALIAQDFEHAFCDVDVLFTPTAPTPAFRIGERVADPVSMYLSDVFTVTANLAGIPGMSVPIGRIDGLPIGGQFLAPWWEESTMLRAAGALESSFSEGGT